MDASITKVLQAVQEEFPPTRKPRRQSSNASTSSNSSIPIMDDNSLPTSSELYTSSSFSNQQSPDPSTGGSSSTSSALSTSPPSASSSAFNPSASSSSSLSSAFTDGQVTPRAERTAPLSEEASQNNNTQYLSQRQEVSTTSALPPRIDTQVQKTGSITSPTSSNSNNSRSPRTRSAPSFISLPPMQSNSGSSSSGFKPSTINKSDGLMLTPGGDDIPFQFKKRPNMQDRRPSREIFA